MGAQIRLSSRVVLENKTRSLPQLKLLLVFLLLALSLNAKSIARIPEASGVCFVEKLKNLLVVGNDGWIYRLKTNGKIVKKKWLGDYDFEGVDYDKSTNRLLIAVEGSRSLFVVHPKKLKIEKKIKINRVYKDVKLLKKSKTNGLEAVAIDDDGNIYVSNQSKITYKKKLKKNASVIFKIDSISKKTTNIKEIYNHGYIDVSGMTFHNGRLYMTSDKKNLLIQYDLKTNKTISTTKLLKSAQEGICFDDKGNMYIADDDGKILKFKEGRF